MPGALLGYLIQLLSTTLPCWDHAASFQDEQTKFSYAKQYAQSQRAGLTILLKFKTTLFLPISHNMSKEKDSLFLKIPQKNILKVNSKTRILKAGSLKAVLTISIKSPKITILKKKNTHLGISFTLYLQH